MTQLPDPSDAERVVHELWGELSIENLTTEIVPAKRFLVEFLRDQTRDRARLVEGDAGESPTYQALFNECGDDPHLHMLRLVIDAVNSEAVLNSAQQEFVKNLAGDAHDLANGEESDPWVAAAEITVYINSCRG